VGAVRAVKLDDISRNDQILLAIERGKFAVRLLEEITGCAEPGREGVGGKVGLHRAR
jgi:hypothetical protein